MPALTHGRSHGNQGHADGHDQYEPTSKSDASLAALGLLAVSEICPAIVNERGETRFEIVPAELVRHEKRLTDRVGGRIG